MTQSKKLWGGRFEKATNSAVEAFTESISFDYRLAADVLAHGDGKRGVHAGVSLRTQNLGQAHHLAFRVGQLQAHVVLAGDGFHHADADQRK